ncbi:MFS transporter [Legionella maioricensis]|uniref:MFS transporter n=1 Tax=Legionella maioricensis TaxID=2896528 RepID=UPI0020285FA7|nr:MFS transporter [Legionella maioricensis]
MCVELGSIVHATIATLLSAEHMQSYGWRIPFIIGGVLGLLSFALRRELHETSQFVAVEQEHAVEKLPIIVVFNKQFASVLVGLFITAICAVIVTSLFLFTPAYFSKVLHLPANAYVWQHTLAIVVGFCLTIFFGYLTDRIEVNKLVIALSLSTSLLAYPIFIIMLLILSFMLVHLLQVPFCLAFLRALLPDY